ncbi:ribosome 60S biogenesis N-terminal-domain-containing protein [Trametes punicea]|nr:ribosome 60S biogenesis N-terminal-domain-containing protein [Trametes punicea]
MPIHDQTSSEKSKVEVSSKQSYKYSSAKDIQRALRAQSEAGLIEGLTALRNQLTVNLSDGPVAVNDERLLLAKEWLEADPGAQELFGIWEATNARQHSLLAAIVGVLATALHLLSSHYTFHAYAQSILRALLSQQWTRTLNLYLSGQHTDLILHVQLCRGRDRKSVLEAFAWEMKSLPKLLQMRRRFQTAEGVDTLQRPDIRTLYILFVLSFIDTTAASSVKATFLEQHRDAFTIIFKGLWQDSYSVIRRVLEVCWSGLWSDLKLKRTLKIQVFNESILFQLLRIYDRNTPEGPDPVSVPADVVHHFLLAICTHPGAGLCFHDRGWYPREADADQRGFVDAEERYDEDGQRGGRIHNKILANVIKTLKVNEDPRQQELALKVLAACPELVSGYWSSVSFALEPRLSSKWLANIAFFGAVASLPVPTSSFLLPESGSSSSSIYHPSPPPLPTVMDNIFPTDHIKTHISRGLQAASPLVQHVTAMTLAKCLLKFEQVLNAFREVERALEENEEEGLWARRRREVEREVRKRIPDFQVIVGFSQRINEPSRSSSEGHDKDHQSKQNEKDKQEEKVPNSTRTALLSESAHRLLFLYHRLLPSVVAEARFDAGKLLQAIEDMLLQGPVDCASAGLDTLRQLHVLRLLRESEHFTWCGKSGTKHSNFHILLKAYVKTPVPAVRTAIVALLQHILSAGVLFQHDADELALWLDSLPHTRRFPGTIAPDGAPLTDEGDSVISFLDDCVQRCVKTPYKYVEELQAIYVTAGKIGEREGRASSIGDQPEAFPSPLLATVLEQLGAKLRGKFLSPSNALALFSFVRKVLLRIASKSLDLLLVFTFMEQLATLVDGQDLFPQQPIMDSAIKREIRLLRDEMEQLQDPQEPMDHDVNPAVQEFLTQVESIDEPTSGLERQKSAYELVDWLRIICPRIDASGLQRLVRAVERLHPPALWELLQYLNPREASLFACPTLVSDETLPFDLLLIHSSHNVFKDASARTSLIGRLFNPGVDHLSVKRAVRLILHRLSSHSLPESAGGDYLSLLAEIIQRLQAAGKVEDGVTVVSLCLDSDAIKSFCSRPLGAAARNGLGALLKYCSATGGEDVKEMFSSLTGRWALTIRESLDDASEDQIDTALLWFRYANVVEVLGLLDYLSDWMEHSSSPRPYELIRRVLVVAAETLARDRDAPTHALPVLSRLHIALPNSPQLQPLIASGIAGSLPLCCDGHFPLLSFSGRRVSSIVPVAGQRWSLRLLPLPALSAESFISAEHWTDATVDILTMLLYRQQSIRRAIIKWLESPASESCSPPHLVKLIFTLYDTAQDGDVRPFEGDSISSFHFRRVAKVVKEGDHPANVRSMAVSCITSITTWASSNRPKLFKILREELTPTVPEDLHPQTLAIAVQLCRTIGADARALGEELVDVGLKWAVTHFVDNDNPSEEARALLSHLAELIRVPIPVKGHLVEPVIAAVVQDRLASTDGTKFVRLLATSTNLKPVTVNRYLQTIVQHRAFYELCAVPDPASEASALSARESIIDLLHDLFLLHPNNTCQPSHIDPLMRVYGGSLGSADTKIFCIFHLFESTRKTAVTSLLSEWSGRVDVSSANALEALLALEPSRVLKTCLDFPNRRTAKRDSGYLVSGGESLYDPLFVLLLFAQMLASSAPTSALVWIQLFRTNVVSLLLRALSGKDPQLREIAWAQIATLYRALENADLQEKPHVMHILNLLKDLTTSTPTDEAPRLPAYTTLLLAHAFRGIFYPSNFIYPLTARFMLQRPTLDSADVPMLYSMLYSSSDNWKKERAWIVRFLSDGLVGNEEWRILRRRHTWDLLASLFHSEERDRTFRRGVLEVLANVTCNARATTSLILRHALLSWVEMQVQTVRAEEAIAWARILQNILAVVNSSKVEAATDGEWRVMVGRCVRIILHHPACSMGVFIALVPVMLMLALVPGLATPHTPALLACGVDWLQKMESEVSIPTSGYLPEALDVDQDKKPAIKVHRSQQLFDPVPPVSIELWGECVESLWRISTTLPNKMAEWDALSSRLLIWRSIAGARKTEMGEWVRREVLANLREA